MLSTKVGRLLVPADGIGMDDQGFDVPEDPCADMGLLA